MDLSSYNAAAAIAVTLCGLLLICFWFWAAHNLIVLRKRQGGANQIYPRTRAERLRDKARIDTAVKDAGPVPSLTVRVPASLRLARVISDPQDYRATPEEVQKLLRLAFAELQTETQKLRG